MLLLQLDREVEHNWNLTVFLVIWLLCFKVSFDRPWEGAVVLKLALFCENGICGGDVFN